MTAFDDLKAIADNAGEDQSLAVMVEAIIMSIKLEIPVPVSGFAVASAVYCTLLEEIMRECLKATTPEDVVSALHETTEQVRELIAELTALAPELAQRAKERK